MKKFLKIFLTAILILALILSIVLIFYACNKNKSVGSPNGNSDNIPPAEEEKYETPKTVMDLFDGEKKVWFFCQHEGTPKYNSEIDLIAVTQNKKVVELYYTLVDADYKLNCATIKKGDNPNPFSSKRFTLADFDGLSDDEVIAMAKESYADASGSFIFDIKGSDYMFDVTNGIIGMQSLPYEIQYSGFLDNSGNNLQTELIKLFDWSQLGEYAGLRGDPKFLIEVDKFIMPTTVKSEEYVGIDGTTKCLVTKNNFKSFGELSYDSIDGMTDWYAIYGA